MANKVFTEPLVSSVKITPEIGHSMYNYIFELYDFGNHRSTNEQLSDAVFWMTGELNKRPSVRDSSPRPNAQVINVLTPEIAYTVLSIIDGIDIKYDEAPLLGKGLSWFKSIIFRKFTPEQIIGSKR